MTNDISSVIDPYEMTLLELIAQCQARAQELAEKAQYEYENDETALLSYVEHMEELSFAKAYMTALVEYRKYAFRKMTQTG